MATLLAIAVSVQLLANYQVSDGHFACQNLDIRTLNNYHVSFPIHLFVLRL